MNLGVCGASGGMSAAAACGPYATGVNGGAVGCYPSTCYAPPVSERGTVGSSLAGASAFVNPAGEKKSFGLSAGLEGHASVSGADADIASANRELAEVFGP